MSITQPYRLTTSDGHQVGIEHTGGSTAPWSVYGVVDMRLTQRAGGQWVQSASTRHYSTAVAALRALVNLMERERFAIADVDVVRAERDAARRLSDVLSNADLPRIGGDADVLVEPQGLLVLGGERTAEQAEWLHGEVSRVLAHAAQVSLEQVERWVSVEVLTAVG